MKILLVHSNLIPSGGDSIYTLRLGKLLESKGHDVAYFGNKSANNIKHKYSAYEAEEITFNQIYSGANLIRTLRSVKNSIYSTDAKNKIAKLLDEFQPDIVHLQSVHYYLTTSIIKEIKKRKIPIIWTQHNFAMICCNFLLNNNKICEKCKPNKFYSPILTRCKKKSLGASIVGSLQLYYDYFVKSYYKADTIILISNFFKNKFIEFGMDPRKMRVIPNFFEKSFNNRNFNIIENDYILYFGRLSPEKGVEHLIHAMKFVGEKIKLKIVGDGPQSSDLQKLKTELDLHNVIFLGEKKGEELDSLIARSYFTIIPSVCYENFPNTIVESFYFSKPVIGSDIGGIPELVQEGKTGLLFRPGNSEELAQKINYLYENPSLQKDLGNKGKQFIEENLNPDLIYQKLMDVYNSVTLRNQDI